MTLVKKIAFQFLLLFAASGAVSCGSNREIQKEDKPLDPAISIEDGPSGINVFSVGSREDLERRGPNTTMLHAKLKRLENGTYELWLSWTFQGAVPTSWRIRGFQEAHDPVTSSPEFNEVVERKSESGDTTQFESRPLSPGRRYLYEFDAIVMEPALNGSARIKTVTIDLRDAR